MIWSCIVHSEVTAFVENFQNVFRPYLIFVKYGFAATACVSIRVMINLLSRALRFQVSIAVMIYLGTPFE
jgi:hypothetical protein